jgi:hypothetical protein
VRVWYRAFGRIVADMRLSILLRYDFLIMRMRPDGYEGACAYLT